MHTAQGAATDRFFAFNTEEDVPQWYDVTPSQSVSFRAGLGSAMTFDLVGGSFANPVMYIYGGEGLLVVNPQTWSCVFA